MCAVYFEIIARPRLTRLCRQLFDDQLGQAFRLRLARGAVAELRHGNPNADAVLARRHTVAPPQSIIGADLDGNGLGLDAMLLKRPVKIVEEFACIVWATGPVHNA